MVLALAVNGTMFLCTQGYTKDWGLRRFVSHPLGSVKPNHQWLEAVHIKDQCMVLLTTILDNCLRYWAAVQALKS